MQEIINALPTLGPFLEKGGVIGVLVLIIMVLGYEVRRLRSELRVCYGSLNCQRMLASRYKTHLDYNKIQIEIDDILRQFPDIKE